MAGPLMVAGLQAGASLLSGLFGNRAQKKAANAQFNYQVQLNQGAFNQQLHLNREAYQQQDALLNKQNSETRSLNDRVDAFNRDILANHSTNEDTSFSQGSVDFDRLVKDSEAAGFNPLTVLRAGGLAGYSTTNVKTTSKVARDLMTYFSPQQTPQAPMPGQAPTPGQAPQVQYENPIGDALKSGLQAYLNYDKHAATRQELELGIARAQLDNLRSDTALNNRRFAIPTWTGSNTKRTSGGFAGKVKGALGDVATPTPGEVKVTNPWPVGVVNPHLRDASAHEDRYGEVASSGIGLVNLAADGLTNIVQSDYGKKAVANDKATINSAVSRLKSMYQTMVDAWNSPSWNSKVKVQWR